MLLLCIWEVNFGGNHVTDLISILRQIRPGLLSFLYFIIHTFFPISHQPSHHFYLRKIFIIYVDFSQKIYLCHTHMHTYPQSMCTSLYVLFFFSWLGHCWKKNLSMTEAGNRDEKDGTFWLLRFRINFRHNRLTVGELCLAVNCTLQLCPWLWSPTERVIIQIRKCLKTKNN